MTDRLAQAKQALAFIEYGPDWDSYGANPPEPAALVHAARFLLDSADKVGVPVEVDVMLSVEGHVMIEWPTGAINVYADGTIERLLDEDESPK